MWWQFSASTSLTVNDCFQFDSSFEFRRAQEVQSKSESKNEFIFSLRSELEISTQKYNFQNSTRQKISHTLKSFWQEVVDIIGLQCWLCSPFFQNATHFPFVHSLRNDPKNLNILFTKFFTIIFLFEIPEDLKSTKHNLLIGKSRSRWKSAFYRKCLFLTILSE